MKPSLVALLGSTLLLSSLGLSAGAAADDSEAVELMFVQNAGAMHYADGTLTLEEVNPSTLYFGDRPSRVVGSLGNEAFVAVWNSGKDNFGDDPPNAALALSSEPGKAPVIVELVEVAMNEGNLVYEMRILDGEMPAESGPVTLFIDPRSWGGTSLGANVDPATDPELDLGSGLSMTSGPAFANMSEPESMQGETYPGGGGGSRCGSHSLLSFNICF